MRVAARNNLFLHFVPSQSWSLQTIRPFRIHCQIKAVPEVANALSRCIVVQHISRLCPDTRSRIRSDIHTFLSGASNFTAALQCLIIPAQTRWSRIVLGTQLQSLSVAYYQPCEELTLRTITQLPVK